MWQVHSSLREPGLGYEGQVAAQPSARLQCPPGELVFLLQLSPWGGHLLTTPDIEEWEQFPVRAPPPFCCPLPSTWGICLAELINLFNDVVSVFHIYLCPENLPTTVLPRKRAFPPGLLYELEPASLCGENDWHSISGVGTGVGEHQGTVLWISWMFRMTLLIHKCDIFVACRLTQCSKSIWWKEDLAFFIFFMGDGIRNIVHTSDSWALQDKKWLLG